MSRRRVYVIGEMAGGHERSPARAHGLIDAAAKAGCQAAKTQWCSDVPAMAQRRGVRSAEGYARLDFPVAWHGELAKRCHARGVDYIVTVFLTSDVVAVARDVDRLKIASLEARDAQLVQACLDTKKPVILSTGCMSAPERSELIRSVLARAAPNQVDFLHAVCAYPVPVGDSNLLAMVEACDGYSDQTGRVVTGALAVMLGATILEVHYRLDETDRQNPDYAHSLTPAQLQRYVDLVRLAEAERGDGEKKVMPSEQPYRQYRVVRP